MAESGLSVEKGGTRESCNLCGAFENLQRCARCKRVYYCSKEHQRQHWKHHKKTCHSETSQFSTTTTNNNNIALDRALQTHDRPGMMISGSAFLPKNTKYAAINNRTETADVISNNTTSSTQNIPRQRIQNLRNSDSRKQQQPQTLTRYNNTDKLNTDKSEVFRQASNHYSILKPKLKMHSKQAEAIIANTQLMQKMCQQIASDLQKFGICVIDRFLGEELGTAILDEVKTMYVSGVFRDGAVVKNRSKDSSATVRSDKITWITETDEKCQHIVDLIGIVDSLIAQCIQVPNNGIFEKYEITGRTQAMVACYPGDGAHYVKHVDNPNNDGRCITSIYYLNKNWTEACGGLLRIFPEGNENQVADIRPIFDRILFFWSDRRNPHEVQPSHRTRYAITVWYYDKKDREHMQLTGKNDVESIRIS